MTRFIDINMLTEMLEKVGINTFFEQMTQAVEEDFKRWPSFEKSARVASHSKQGVIELMPTSDGELYGFKYVNGHPANAAKGVSTVMAFGALSSVETGYPLLLSELTLTTAFRTAATSVMATRALCRKNSRVMALIGSGAQSEFHAIAFHLLLNINEIRIFDVDKAAMQKLKNNLASYPELKIKIMGSTVEAVKGADIVTTITADKTLATIITPDMIEPGMHINGVGGDCPGKTEIDAEVLRQGKIFVEFEPQTRVEGDIQQLPDDFPVNGLWRVLSGLEPGRDNDQQITIFDSVGFAMEDFSALRYLYRLSGELGMGEDINLVPELVDPKDLFFLTQNGSVCIASQKSKAA